MFIAKAQKEASKQFFFAKKNQKTFAPSLAERHRLVLPTRALAEPGRDVVQANETKVFCFFFSKKK